MSASNAVQIPPIMLKTVMLLAFGHSILLFFLELPTYQQSSAKISEMAENKLICQYVFKEQQYTKTFAKSEIINPRLGNQVPIYVHPIVNSYVRVKAKNWSHLVLALLELCICFILWSFVKEQAPTQQATETQERLNQEDRPLLEEELSPSPVIEKEPKELTEAELAEREAAERAYVQEEVKKREAELEALRQQQEAEAKAFRDAAIAEAEAKRDAAVKKIKEETAREMAWIEEEMKKAEAREQAIINDVNQSVAEAMEHKRQVEALAEQRSDEWEEERKFYEAEAKAALARAVAELEEKRKNQGAT